MPITAFGVLRMPLILPDKPSCLLLATSQVRAKKGFTVA